MFVLSIEGGSEMHEFYTVEDANEYGRALRKGTPFMVGNGSGIYWHGFGGIGLKGRNPFGGKSFFEE